MSDQPNSTPESGRGPSARTMSSAEVSRARGGDLIRITELETRVGDLATKLTQNFAMVEEVLHTQRDFKDILLRLVNSNAPTAPLETNGMTLQDPPNAINAANTSLPVGDQQPLAYGDQSPVPAASSQPSWMSADTVLLTPNTRDNFRPM